MIIWRFILKWQHQRLTQYNYDPTNNYHSNSIEKDTYCRFANVLLCFSSCLNQVNIFLGLLDEKSIFTHVFLHWIAFFYVSAEVLQVLLPFCHLLSTNPIVSKRFEKGPWLISSTDDNLGIETQNTKSFNFTAQPSYWKPYEDWLLKGNHWNNQ